DSYKRCHLQDSFNYDNQWEGKVVVFNFSPPSIWTNHSGRKDGRHRSAGPTTAMLRRRKRKATSRRLALRSSRQLNAPQSSTSAVPSHTSGSTLSPAVLAVSPACTEDTAVEVVRQWAPMVGVRLLLLAVGGMCQGWRSRLAQVCAGLLNALLYWRGYTQQLESLQQQVAELRREVSVLHCALKISPEKRRAPLVTVADLQKVQLRRSLCDLQPNLSRVLYLEAPLRNPSPSRT
ncbi:hypothetical protein JZ751_023163, partial [Albula glossodonta]